MKTNGPIQQCTGSRPTTAAPSLNSIESVPFVGMHGVPSSLPCRMPKPVRSCYRPKAHTRAYLVLCATHVVPESRPPQFGFFVVVPLLPFIHVEYSCWPSSEPLPGFITGSRRFHALQIVRAKSVLSSTTSSARVRSRHLSPNTAISMSSHCRLTLLSWCRTQQVSTHVLHPQWQTIPWCNTASVATSKRVTPHH